SAEQALHHLQEWNIALADCFEEPVFFVKEFVLGMSHERQMRVENEGERAGHDVIPSKVEGSRSKELSGFAAGSLDFARDDWVWRGVPGASGKNRGGDRVLYRLQGGL